MKELNHESKVEEDADRLEGDRTYHMVNATLDVEITMPELTRLVLKDGATAIVTGFGEGFEVEVDFLSELSRE